MFQKVLVPLDGSELAEGILPYVSYLARDMRIPLLLLWVVDPDTVRLPGGLRVKTDAGSGQSISLGAMSAPVAAIFEEIEVEAKRALDAVARRLTDDGVAVQSVVSFGKPADEIMRVADKEGCDVIAMSTHARNALARGILGSVTDKVIHISHLPTLTITPDRAKQYWQEGATISRILVPLDGSELAESVLPYVEHLAQKLSLQVVLVRVAHMASVRTPYSDAYLYYSKHVDLDVQLEEDAAEYLKGVAKRFTSKGLTVDWKVLKGAPALAIDELARATPHDIVVLATHGRSGLDRWILGSITVRRPCPSYPTRRSARVAVRCHNDHSSSSCCTRMERQWLTSVQTSPAGGRSQPPRRLPCLFTRRRRRGIICEPSTVPSSHVLGPTLHNLRNGAFERCTQSG